MTIRLQYQSKAIFKYPTNNLHFMGRIKSLMVKRAAKQMLAKDAEKFNDQFNHNKRILGRTMPSKPIRNKIAGYMARLVKMKKAEAIKAAQPKPVIVEDEAPQYQQY